MDYKPYSPEWHRKRYLKEALDKYFDDYIENDVIFGDMMDILSARMSAAVDKTRAADRALADKATEALRQIRADSKTPTTAEVIKQTQQKPPTAPKPPTVTKPLLQPSLAVPQPSLDHCNAQK